MLQGTRFLFGAEAVAFDKLTTKLADVVKQAGYNHFIPPAIVAEEFYAKRAGPELKSQIYTFADLKERPVCLTPEVSAFAVHVFKKHWRISQPRPVKLWYLTRCYRYEKSQEGRYREFWQFGIEHLGDYNQPRGAEKAMAMLEICLKEAGLREYAVRTDVPRDMSHYKSGGFEIEADCLGSQKSLAAGGEHECGSGWAIGVDRLLLALKKGTT